MTANRENGEASRLGWRARASTPLPPGAMTTNVTVPERRKHERLRYPAEQRPSIVIEEMPWPIDEISEGGLVFCTRDLRFKPRQPFAGRIRFTETSVAVEGIILRMDADRVIAACLQQRVPPEHIAQERQRLGVDD